MPTIPDSNVLLDVIKIDPVWSAWSSKHLAAAAREGTLVLSPVTLSEISGSFSSMTHLRASLDKFDFNYDPIPWEAAYLAGKSHHQYRRHGGSRERTLPDFLVGAHARVKDYKILTRDGARYRSYFNDVIVIAPDTHP